MLVPCIGLLWFLSLRASYLLAQSKCIQQFKTLLLFPTLPLVLENFIQSGYNQISAREIQLNLGGLKHYRVSPFHMFFLCKFELNIVLWISTLLKFYFLLHTTSCKVCCIAQFSFLLFIYTPHFFFSCIPLFLLDNETLNKTLWKFSIPRENYVLIS